MGLLCTRGEITQKFPCTNDTLFRASIKISANSLEDRNDIIILLQDEKQEFVLYESIAEKPIKVIFKGIHASTPKEYVKQELEVTTIIQFKNFKEQSLHSVFQVDIKRSAQAQQIFNITHLCHFKITVESPRRRNTATTCYKCAEFHHTAKNCHHNLRCIKCGKNHATRDCNIQENLPNPTCINCNSTGHTAAWKGCPAFSKFNTKQVNSSYANITKRNITQQYGNHTQPKEIAQDPFNLPSLNEVK
ncbi:Nucleic-acid-binding protein from transposon X-element [Araneus ventricosus]|uniref:Nucleic-acid-binding protein from transposon X-element n=1 Tax=Araneus ventricosus TaxID=182803 RepID=A0A4Y2JSL5_ARAVE|nr:Nucleic-acid-binding protein from transposon X-element [Araneus ventricosus]